MEEESGDLIARQLIKLEVMMHKKLKKQKKSIEEFKELVTDQFQSQKNVLNNIVNMLKLQSDNQIQLGDSSLIRMTTQPE